jgi:prepilin-type processing-associated H-X9-DG protein
MELLVVIAMAGLMLGILFPAVRSTRARARAAICQIQIRQLVIANTGYASDNDGFLCVGAEDIWDNAGLRRWHGVRRGLDEPFDPAGSPLSGYLANRRIKQCPDSPAFLTGRAWQYNFEQGCGGYGYNLTYIGSRLWDKTTYAGKWGYKEAYRKSTKTSELANPTQTLMFADTAISTDGVNLIEYSFAEPPFAVIAGQLRADMLMSASIHFRHLGHANVVWSDGHVDGRARSPVNAINAYGVDSSSMGLGWFEPVDNTMFDLR